MSHAAAALVAAGIRDTADITGAITGAITSVVRTLDHADLVVGPRCWPIDSTHHVSKNR